MPAIAFKLVDFNRDAKSLARHWCLRELQELHEQLGMSVGTVTEEGLTGHAIDFIFNDEEDLYQDWKEMENYYVN